MLWKRIMTALILIPLVILVIFYLHPIGFMLVLTAVMTVAIWEWTKLIGLQTLTLKIFYMVSIVFGFIIALSIAPIVLTIGIVIWLINIYFIFNYEKFKTLWAINLFYPGLMGLLIFTSCWLGLNLIRLSDQGSVYLLLLLIFIWSADTGAYFIGKQWGRHKLAPNISPGKSIEGLIGGLLLTVIVSIIVTRLLKLDWQHSLILSGLAFFVALISVVGDLFESMVKRQAKVKDSGHLLPGHGGMLDRIDSLIAAVPFYALGVHYLIY